ncbi:MAG: hypothetical protein NTZ83_03400 [Candidatus Pacearchaeota archaeon]|nr:hypothetical protein [Candidatus Pacearchaeota archaeon]
MKNKNKEINQDAINAELFGNDQKRYEDGSCGPYAKQLNVEPHGYVPMGYAPMSDMEKTDYVTYITKSKPEKKIKLPVKYAYRAEKLVEFALESKDEVELLGKINQYPSLTGMPLTDKTLGLMGIGKKAGTPKSLKLQDEVYFLSCFYMAQNDLSIANGLERLEAIKTTEFLRKTLESL